jgi:hypothetical protein
MIAVLDKLDKMINLEIENGYDNKAVIGGLDGVLTWWPRQVRTACTQADQESIVERVIWLIQAYANRNRTERARAADEIKQKLVALNAAIEGSEASEAVEPEAPEPPASRIRAAPAHSVEPESVEDADAAPGPGSAEESRLGLNSPAWPASASRRSAICSTFSPDGTMITPHSSRSASCNMAIRSRSSVRSVRPRPARPKGASHW